MTELNVISPMSEISFLKQGRAIVDTIDSSESSFGEDDQQHHFLEECNNIPNHSEFSRNDENLSNPRGHSYNETLKNTKSHPPYHQELFDKLQEELKVKSLMAENQIRQNTSLQEKIVELQVNIASLGETVIQLENKNENLEREKDALQKLLATSREIAKHKVELDRSTDKSFDRSLMDQTLDIVKESPDVGGSIDSSMFHESLVIDSLRKELEITKGREDHLRHQLALLVHEKDGPNKIMETISESQQEAISYLSSEVEELRSLLIKEGEKIATQMAHSITNIDTIHVLEEENQAVAAQMLEQEKRLETLQQDLSMKLGENACLRDEIAELEQKLHSSRPTIDRLKNSHGIPSPDRSKSGRGGDSSTSRSITRRDSDTEFSLITVEMENGDQGDVALIETYHHDDTFSQSKITKKFDILKRAMKQKYEKKVQNLEDTISAQQNEIKKLVEALKRKETELVKSQECAEDLEIKRVFMEAEMNQEAEGMRVALKDRSLQIERLKKALLRLQTDREGNPSQSNLKVMSDYLIDGVGASVEYIESFITSFDVEDMKMKSNTT